MLEGYLKNRKGLVYVISIGDEPRLSCKCVSCEETKTVCLKGRNLSRFVGKWHDWLNGTKIQDAFPDFTPYEREFFMTGICSECWDEMFL